MYDDVYTILPIENGFDDSPRYNLNNWKRNLTIENVRSGDVLRWACEKGHLDVVQYLCKTFELTVEDIRSCDNLALQLACENGHLKIIQWLYSACELTVEDIRSDYNRALRFACLYGHLHVVQYLCETFGLTVEDIRSNNLALKLAWEYGHLNVIQWICEHFHLDYGSEISALYEQNMG